MTHGYVAVGAERTVIGEPVRSALAAGLSRTAVSVKPGGAGA